MTLRRSIPVVALSAAVAVLAIPIAIGSAEARIGAVFALAGIFGGLAGAVHQQRREHADDVDPPSLIEVTSETLSGLGLSVVGMAIALVALFVGIAGPGSGPRSEAGWPGPVIATIAGAALVIGMIGSIRSIWRREGIERQNLLEATCIAFFVTVLFAAGYGMFEAIAGAPRITMWAAWCVGAFTWAIAADVLRRRTS